MAYCKNCGKEIDSNAYLCIHCGVLTRSETNYIGNQSDGTTLGIIGIIFAFLFPLVTYICSGIGLSKANKAYNSKGKNLNIIALIIAGVNSIIGMIILF